MLPESRKSRPSAEADAARAADKVDTDRKLEKDALEVLYPSGWKLVSPFPLTILEATYKKHSAFNKLKAMRDRGAIFSVAIRACDGWPATLEMINRKDARNA